MGLWSWLRRLSVGSDPYYASYDKAMQRIKGDMEKAKARGIQRRQLFARIQAQFWATFAVLYVAVLAYAAWVLQQPHGTFTAIEHSVRVAPVLAAPVVALLLHWLLGRLAGALGHREARRVKLLEDKLRKIVAELKDSTHYERTLQLLKKYDPDFVPPMPPAPTAAGKVGIPALKAGPQAGSAAQAGGAAARLATSTLQGAGSHLLPVLGQLWSHAADKLIADDPVLVQLMREAQREAEELRQRLSAAEARAVQLGAENRQLREQLGLPPALGEERAEGGSVEAGGAGGGDAQGAGAGAVEGSIASSPREGVLPAGGEAAQVGNGEVAQAQLSSSSSPETDAEGQGMAGQGGQEAREPKGSSGLAGADSSTALRRRR